MAYDDTLAARIRVELQTRDDVVEKKMFGGLAIMVRGHMTVGITGADLMVRVGKDAHPECLDEPHAREMDFTGKGLKGFVYVDPEGTDDRDTLRAWIDRGLAHTESLPPK